MVSLAVVPVLYCYLEESAACYCFREHQDGADGTFLFKRKGTVAAAAAIPNTTLMTGNPFVAVSAAISALLVFFVAQMKILLWPFQFSGKFPADLMLQCKEDGCGQ